MLVHAFELIPAWQAARQRLGHMLVALDFDGTLAPIVPHYDDAQLLPAAAPVLERLAARADTEIALISGRGLHDLRKRVPIPDLYFAGNHGLEIHGPDLDDIVPGALASKQAVQRCRAALEAALRSFRGVQVEDKELSLSVHYRMVDDPAEQQQVETAVDRVFQQHQSGLRLTAGKRVREVRPDIDWHKGRALLYIIAEIASVRGPSMLPMFVGDDRTDEDGFQALSADAATVLVGDPHTKTAARSYVRSPEEVVALLERLL
jgi:trehalose 6-phosphate phosphatase